MEEKYVESSIQNGDDCATFITFTHPFTDSCEHNTSALLITAGQAKKDFFKIGSVIVVVIDTINTGTDGRNSISTVIAEAEIDTGETGTDIIGG